jgi:hypothetical protein
MDFVVAIKAHRQEELRLIEPISKPPPPMMNLTGYARAYLAEGVEG